jgi:hypothetical protein
MGKTSTAVNALNLADGPELSDEELGVHIIFVPADCVAGPAHGQSASAGGLGTATVAQVSDLVQQAWPTDIVVFAGQPFHVASLPGHKKLLREHPQVHQTFPQTVLVISIKDQQRAVWWSETNFTITKIEPSHHANNPFFREADTIAPRSPFASPDPPPTRIENVSGRDLYVARSTVPVAAAAFHMYKIEFTMEGQEIDPDMYCGAP